ncbi:arylamine N-acetyltransferase [Streptomyces sp. NPDC059894]|uniref:arylamine N-acetyltransferase family protein n=1 Tax=unclassified Streptomyces TaxID=2593676 RepID=UPI003666FF4E
MFDAATYLDRIGCGDARTVSVESLRQLQKNHLMTVPYNRNVPLTGTLPDGSTGFALVDVDQDALFELSVLEGRGGICFHLNRLFFRLLTELGYEADLIGAGTAEGLVYFGSDIDHMLIRVTLGGEHWLVDVGYPGPSYLEPLSLTEGVQRQYGSQFRLAAEEGRLVLSRRGRATRWSEIYRVRDRSRRPEDWTGLETHLRRQAEEATPEDADTILCGRAYADGQTVLKGRRLLTVRDGRERVRTLVDDDELRRELDEILTPRTTRQTGTTDKAGTTQKAGTR